jgi:hypothetical protein
MGPMESALAQRLCAAFERADVTAAASNPAGVVTPTGKLAAVLVPLFYDEASEASSSSSGSSDAARDPIGGCPLNPWRLLPAR